MRDSIAFAAIEAADRRPVRHSGLLAAGLLSMLLFSGVTSAQTSVTDSYESPISSGYLATNSTTFTDSEGRVYTGYSGVGPNDLGGAPRTGNQFLFIENFQGFNASVSQTYQLDPGTYSLSYYEGGRVEPYGAFTYDLVVDGIVLGSFTTDSAGGAPTVQRSVPSFIVGPGGTTVTFQGTGPNNQDNTGFFDDLTITVVPEPTSLALLGLSGSLLLARRRRGTLWQ